jgi:hypothetical protein
MKTTVYFSGHGSGQVPRQGSARQSGSGGGARVVERSAPKAEPRAYGMNPAGVSQYGLAHGNHATDSGGRTTQGGVQSIVGGAGYEAVGPTRSVPGPGGGRTVMPCGSMGQHGPVAGTPFEPSDKGWAPPPGGIHRK